MAGDIQFLDMERDPISAEEMEKLMLWSWGQEGVRLARLWKALNDRHFEGVLTPLPIWLLKTFPYGRTIGLFTANMKKESLHIQIKLDPPEYRPSILFHEMIHQYLCETGQPTDHNTKAWCTQVMRLAKEVWNHDIWASPANPIKVNGTSTRIQKPAESGEESIPRGDLSRFPLSLGLMLPAENYL